jgi:hypothetical protein
VLTKMIVIARAPNERILHDVSREERLLCEDVVYKVKQNLKEILAENANLEQEEFGGLLSDLENTHSCLMATLGACPGNVFGFS